MDIREGLFKLYRTQFERRIRKQNLEESSAPRAVIDKENELIDRVNSKIKSLNVRDYVKDAIQLAAYRFYLDFMIDYREDEHVFGNCTTCEYLDRNRIGYIGFFCLKENKDSSEVIGEDGVCYVFKHADISKLSSAHASIVEDYEKIEDNDVRVAKQIFATLEQEFFKKHNPNGD